MLPLHVTGVVYKTSVVVKNCGARLVTGMTTSCNFILPHSKKNYEQFLVKLPLHRNFVRFQ